MIEKLEIRLNTAQQNKAHIKIMEVTIINKPTTKE